MTAAATPRDTPVKPVTGDDDIIVSVRGLVNRFGSKTVHEGLDLVSIRAVRIETRTLLTLQAFLRPGGKIFLFRGAGTSVVETEPPPPLAWMASYPLVESLHSKLVVLSKTRV